MWWPLVTITMKNADNEHKVIERHIERSQQRFMLLVNRDDFQEDVVTIRVKWNIPKKGLKTGGGLSEWRARHHKTGLRVDVNSLVSKYKLPPRWNEAIKTYILTNIPRYFGPLGVWTRVNVSGTNDDEVSVILDPNTTRQDLIDAWPDIEFHLKNLKTRNRDKFQRVNEYVFKRGKLVYDLHKKGATYQEMTLQLKKRYSRDFTQDDIHSMIKNYKKVMGIN